MSHIIIYSIYGYAVRPAIIVLVYIVLDDQGDAQDDDQQERLFMPAAEIGIVEDGNRKPDQQEKDKSNKIGCFSCHGSPSP